MGAEAEAQGAGQPSGVLKQFELIQHVQRFQRIGLARRFRPQRPDRMMGLGPVPEWA